MANTIIDNTVGNFFFDVSRLKVTNMVPVLILGHNPDTDTGTEEDIWQVGGTIVYLTTAETMNIVSTSLADASAGTGARTVLIQGVNNDFTQVSDTITMNGTTPVETSQGFLRINNMRVVTAGSGLTNAGDINATASSAATIQSQANAGGGISRNSHFTVPLGKTLYLIQAEFNAAKISGGGTPQPRFIGLTRNNGIADSPFLLVFDKALDTGVQVDLNVDLPIYPRLLEKTDLKFRANTDVNNTEVQCRVYGILETN